MLLILENTIKLQALLFVFQQKVLHPYRYLMSLQFLEQPHVNKIKQNQREELKMMFEGLQL